VATRASPKPGTRLECEEVRVDRNGADVKVVQKKHELNPMT